MAQVDALAAAVDPRFRALVLLAAFGGLARLDVGRLRATWLAEHLGRLGLTALLAAAGVRCSQRLGDLAAILPTPDEVTLMTILGAEGQR